MYAIIKTGGKQYCVEEGKIITVEKLDVAAGDEVTFEEVRNKIGNQKVSKELVHTILKDSMK